MSGGVPRRLQYLPQGNEDKLLLKSILCLKRRSCLHPPALYSVWTARSKYYSGITMNSNYPRQWNQWKHWAKWHRLGGKGDLLWHFLIFSSLKCNKQTFTVPSASKTFLEKHCQNKTPRPTSSYATRSGRLPSGPPYLHSVYAFTWKCLEVHGYVAIRPTLILLRVQILIFSQITHCATSVVSSMK